jgi:hypothetical protein
MSVCKYPLVVTLSATPQAAALFACYTRLSMRIGLRLHKPPLHPHNRLAADHKRHDNYGRNSYPVAIAVSLLAHDTHCTQLISSNNLRAHYTHAVQTCFSHT